MPTTDLGACEWFVWDLRRSNLIDRGQLDQVVSDFLKRQPRAEPPALAEYLVKQDVLTQFQADRILQGKTQGLVLGPYTLMDSIGTGSMGTVYKAFSKTDNKWYAVKVLPRRSMWNVRLARRQVRSFEQFNHPAVVPFVDVGTSGGLHYLAWPLVDGESMDKVLEREGKVTPGQAAHLALQVANGLAACHHHGIFHGLLKPSNMMLTPEGQVCILDLGIGALLSENEGESLVDTMSTANTMTSGLDCSSPESIMEPTNRTPAGDQYSLGCCLYHFLTGKYPFPEGSAVEKMMAHQYKQPTPVKELAPDTPDELVEVVERLMQKTPESRYSNTDEAVEALRPLASESNPLVAKSTMKNTAPPPAGNGPSAKRGSSGDVKAGAGAGASAKGSASLRAPTPAVPSRKSLRDSISQPAAPPKRELPPDEEEEDQDAEDRADDEEGEGDEEEGGEEGDQNRTQQILMMVGIVVVVGITFWFAVRWFSGNPLWPPF
jgi:serine/threonine-protein kinase